MTFRNLEDALVTEVGVILKDVATTRADGAAAVGFSGYAYSLPVTMAGEDEDSLFPFYIVKTLSGRTDDDEDYWHVSADVVIGVHDDAPAMGHEHVLIAIQRIVDRFANDPSLGGRFRAEQDMEWVVSDDNPYPWHFGAVTITFSVGKIGRKYYG